LTKQIGWPARAYIVVADLSGKAQAARILAAAELAGSELDELLADRAETTQECVFDEASGAVRARRVTRLGAITLAEAPLPKPDAADAMAALCAGIRRLGLRCLPFSAAGQQLRDRIDFLHKSLGDPWPDVSDKALLDSLETWFAPVSARRYGLEGDRPRWASPGIAVALRTGAQTEINRLAPTHYEAPTGSRLPIRYEEEGPVVAIRVQELFGLS
jgi:ATP-dependent helicase HrpB